MPKILRATFLEEKEYYLIGDAFEWGRRVPAVEVGFHDFRFQTSARGPDRKFEGIQVETGKVQPRCNHPDQSADCRYERLP